MIEFFLRLFDTSDFPPRWYCGNWSDGHGWLHILSDAGVFSAYMAIPIVLTFFISRRRDIPFPGVFWMFVAFIAFCGVGHLVEAIIFWAPVYRLSAVFKLATAVVSWTTVVTLIRTMPYAMRLRSPEELEREVLARTRELKKSRAELKRANARLTRANAELDRFAEVVSHDLQTPLRAVNSFTQLLEKRLSSVLSGKDKDFMDRVMAGASRMQVLINDLLDYARLNERRAPAEPVDLQELVGSVAAEFVAGHGIADDAIRAEGLPTVLGDETRLRQALQNLIANAVKFSGPKPARVWVTAQERPEAWEISVKDEGIGFGEEEAGRIFEPFYRLPSGDTYEGTGMGLSIVQKIVRQHGGEISARSSPGQGATFTFTIARNPT